LGPDEVLFHEMVHAGRLLGHDDGSDDEEEYFAILIANIYISEKGKSFSSLRRTHDAMSISLTEAEAQPMGYLFKDDNYRMIEKFCGQHQTSPL